jgi:polysaccharide chain length determinant protein (PEP-CTERM system associated)
MSRDILSTATNDESLVVRGMDMFRRRKIVALLVSAAVAAAAVSFALFLPDLYRATAIVLVERPVPEAFVRSVVNGELESRLHVIKQEILSRDRLTDLIKRFNLYPDLRAKTPMDAVLDQMRRDIDIELNGPEQVSGRKTTVSFKLSYTGASDKLVADVTNALATFYVAQNASIRSEEASRTAEFLKAQLDATKRQLDRHEQGMREYTTNHPGELPQQVEVNLAALERLNTQLRLNGERQLKLLEDREKLTTGLTVTQNAVTGERTAIVDAGPDRIEQLKHDLQLLEGQFNSRYPDVVKLKAEIAAAERERADALVREREARASADAAQVAAVGNVQPTARLAALQSLDAEIDKLKTDETGLRQTIVNLEKRLEGVPEREQEFGRLTRDYQAAKDLYDSLLKRYDEAQLGENLETDRHGEQFRVLESALPPSGPVAPNRMRLVLVGLLVALAAGVGTVLAAEQLDPSFHGIEDLREFTRVPVLVSIPRIGPSYGRRALRLTLATASILAVIGIVATLSVHAARGNQQIVWMLVHGA